jgi:hypothetical protein
MRPTSSGAQKNQQCEVDVGRTWMAHETNNGATDCPLPRTRTRVPMCFHYCESRAIWYNTHTRPTWRRICGREWPRPPRPRRRNLGTCFWGFQNRFRGGQKKPDAMSAGPPHHNTHSHSSNYFLTFKEGRRPEQCAMTWKKMTPNKEREALRKKKEAKRKIKMCACN